LDLRERKREDLKIGSLDTFAFLSGKQPKGVGGGLFIVPTTKEPFWGDSPDKSGKALWSPDLSGPSDKSSGSLGKPVKRF
jgi:hypothetical protein